MKQKSLSILEEHSGIGKSSNKVHQASKDLRFWDKGLAAFFISKCPAEEGTAERLWHLLLLS